MSNRELKGLVKARAAAKGNVTRLIKLLNTSTNLDIDQLEARKSKLNEIYDSFMKAQLELEIVEDDQVGSQNDQEDQRAQFEEQYYYCVALISKKIRDLNLPCSHSNANRPVSSMPIAIKQTTDLLPKIQIKPFDGNPIHWHSFHDSFKNLVHDNDELIPVHKFYLLKNALEGPLISITENLNATEENYLVAWKTLKQRCDKPRVIIHTHLQSLFDLPELSRENTSGLRSLIERAEMHINALKSLNQPIEKWDAVLVFLVMRKIDRVTRRAWERTLDNEDMPTFEQLLKFLHKQARGDDVDEIRYDYNRTKDDTSRNSFKPSYKRPLRAQSYVSTEDKRKRLNCNFCGENHMIHVCAKFLQLNENERFIAAQSAKLCINCLRNNHATCGCYLSGCKKCGHKHHTLLHFSNRAQKIQPHSSTNARNGGDAEELLDNNTVPNKCPEPSNQGNNTTLLSAFDITCNSEVLLGTACIIILDKNKCEVPCRVLLDSGSQTHFITEGLADRLMLKKTKIFMPFKGLGGNLTEANYSVTTKIRSRASNFQTEITLVALPTITGLLPARRVRKEELNIPKNISLADPSFHKTSAIDLLIGNTLFYQLLCIGQIKLQNNSVLLQKTRLGWLVTGESKISNKRQVNCQSSFLSINLENQIRRFWEIEELPDKKYFSREEAACEEHFAENIKRDSRGRYIVRLPFNEYRESIGDSFNIALKRFYSLERRLSLNSELKGQYITFLREYEELNHMIEGTDNDNNQIGFYLPHHPVVKDSSATTKVRVVFDASVKSSSGTSLNDTLLQGPTIQDDLFAIIMRFRKYQFVLKADIEKMFRQIEVDKRDAIYQKILWRENSNEPIKTYILKTVTYGTRSAPFLAVRCLKQLAKDHEHDFPEASKILDRDFYMDDLLTGTDNYENAQLLAEQLIKLLELGGFNLRQWLSNETTLLNKLKINNPPDLVCLSNDGLTKILGVNWDPKTDMISYKVKKFDKNKTMTKRTILSEIAQLFDPLGLLGPVVVKAKLIMQQMWREKLNWDESVPQTIFTEWREFKNQLSVINNFSVNRKIILKDAIEVQMHGFSDASERAYGACIFIRSTNKANEHLTTLVCAKSRVAPIKSISLPRLELCAAKLLSNLYASLNKGLHIKFNKTYFYTDSTITLNWILTPPYLLKTFEANRVSEIQSITSTDDWYHVSTTDNPADSISRGKMPEEFLNDVLWLKGPSWLQDTETNWKIKKLFRKSTQEIQTNKSLIVINKTASKFEEILDIIEPSKIFEKFSTITAVNRFVALCLRLIKNKRSNTQIKNTLSVHELNEAHLRVIQLIQWKEFTREMRSLSNGNPILSKSKLLKLNPFVDEFGTLRVGGRIANAFITYNKKYPILLPRNNYVTDLIIRNVHLKNWHTGVRNTLNLVRETYWPIDGKNKVRHLINKCITCFKVNPSTSTYIMGNLPKNRIHLVRPFQNVGLDYCGPFFIKEKKFRNKTKLKAFVVVFVCFATKAVHLELVTDMTTESCLAAIKRFFGRRGKASNLYSDNGTNFVGANNEILKIKALLFSSDHNSTIEHELANEGITWHFTPARSPHFGGLWEAAVKQFKFHLYRTVGDSLFTYEQLNTFIIEIEAILNSRPLIPLSSDPNDLCALTPAHFLIGTSMKALPQPNLQNIKTNTLSVWQHIERVKQHFWSRWYKEYLNELRTRTKWNKGDTRGIEIGALVMVKDDNLPAMHWRLGRIIETHPGTDKVVRVATVKINDGVYKRCVKKLYPLPINYELESV